MFASMPSPFTSPDAGRAAEDPIPPEVRDYQRKLSAHLLDKHNNRPEFAGKVARVDVVMPRPLRRSLDGRYIQAEFDQLVYDSWGRRLPQLESEYFVVTFGTEGAEVVRAEPSIRIGLDAEVNFGERGEMAGTPLAALRKGEAVQPAPATSPVDWRNPRDVAAPPTESGPRATAAIRYDAPF